MTRYFLFVLVFGLIIVLKQAFGHQAQTGWAYPEDCCSEKDCRVASPGELVYTNRGWWVTTTREYIWEDDERIRRSRDHLTHICVSQITPDYVRRPHVVCLFLHDGQG